MISVIIPTLDSAPSLSETLTALVPAVVDGLLRDVIIVDGGSSDETEEIAERAGARFIRAPLGRGAQLAAAVAHAKSDWLLFLHSDTVLDVRWISETHTFIDRVERGHLPPSGAVFRFALNDFGVMPRVLEQCVRLRCLLFALPYGDQGLLIPKKLYQDLGGYKDLPLMEDVDLVRRMGRQKLVFLKSEAVTSAKRYQQEGYLKRMARNIGCLILYYLHLPPQLIKRLYG